MATIEDPDKKETQLAANGDFEAFEALVDKYEGRIYRHLRKMVSDEALAEDLLQETFLNAHRGLPKFTGASKFSTWLFRIATNNALMHLRKKRPESIEYEDGVRGEAELAHMGSSEKYLKTPQSILLSEEGKRQIESAIDDLPALYRSTIILRDVEGFSLAEVAEIMECSVPAVKSRLHRARNSVKDALSGYYSELATTRS
jgi:RNA polymerase sigma-70 factor (ECF subfamily)